MKPVRIQRKRTKGYDMQAESRSINGIECVYVGRPTKFGNPFFVGWDGDGDHEQCCELFRENISAELKTAVQTELRGKNLACFCQLDQPCHADILLQLANE